MNDIIERLLTPEGLTAIAGLVAIFVGGDKLRKYRRAFKLLVKAIQEAKGMRVKRKVKSLQDDSTKALIAKEKKRNGYAKSNGGK